jgi:hypothetical protein
MKLPYTERIIIVMAVIIIVLSALLYRAKADLNALSGWIDSQHEQLQEIDALLSEAERRTSELSENETESLSVSPALLTVTPGSWELRQFVAQGLTDPISELKKDLMSKPELISASGVLGGTMRVYTEEDILILPGSWAYATFEDGHINGGMLLEFTISNGVITWSVIRSQQF